MDTRHLLCLAVCIVLQNTLAQEDATSMPDVQASSDEDDGTSPPKIVEQSDDYFVVLPKNPVEIVCKAEGVPEPTYRWKRDNVDLDIKDTFSLNGGNLVVRRPTEATNGIYRCFAENQYGVAMTNKINFTIAFLDTFLETEPSLFSFFEGDEASIPCNQQASVPEPTVFWTDDSNPGKTIVLDNRVSVDPNFNLRFSNIKIEDMMNYQCNVKNEKIRTQLLSPVREVVVKSRKPIVLRSAAFVYTPAATVIAFRTKKLRLKCMAEGFPTPEITWSKEGEPFPAERTSFESYNQTLVIGDIVKSDVGKYTCTASNGEGAPTSFTATVIIKALPYWENKPEDINVVIGASGELICQADGIPLPGVTWLVNGVPHAELEPSDRRTITEGAGGGRVSIVDAIPEESAVYQCVAENEYGEISASAFVNVQSIPAELTDAPDPFYVTIEGKGIELGCSGQGSPKPVIEWIFKGTALEIGGKYDIVEIGNEASTTSTLMVTGAQVEDSGDYTCSISNGFAAVMASSKVTVRKGTEIIVSPDGPVTVVLGADAIITCEVDHDASLDVEVSWFRDIGSGPVKLNLNEAGGRFKPDRTGSDNLKVHRVEVEDSGTYTCKAVTSEDEAEASAELIVQTVAAAPSNVVVEPRSDDSDTMAKLSWDSGDDGNSPITDYIVSYSTEWKDLGWQEMKTVAASTTRTSLELSPWVDYRFRVVAVNGIGDSEPSEKSNKYTTAAAALTEAPENVVIEPDDPGKMEVTWPEVHPYDQNGPGFKYVIRWREPGSDKWETKEIDDYRITSFVIDSGSNYKELDVEVLYKNDLGAGPAAKKTGFTGEGEPTAAPQNVRVSKNDDEPTMVVITWDEVDDNSINGQLRDFLVYYSMRETQAKGQEPHVCMPDTDCRVGDLTPYEIYEFQVSIRNGQHEGPKSEMVSLRLPQGPPGPVIDLKINFLSDRLYVKWGKPALPNGVISKYTLTHSIVKGMDVENTATITIANPDATSHLIKTKPGTMYRLEIFANNNSTFDGERTQIEDRTRPAGSPVKPIFIQSQINPGREHINVTFNQSETGPAANSFFVFYKKTDDNKLDFMKTKTMALIDGGMITVTELDQHTEYTMKIVGVNDGGETQGPEQTTKTLGGEAIAAAPIYVQGWFIVLLIVIVALLCILLVLCILKSQRGGKYNVSDKEQQRKGDIESTPLKDEGGFEEFDPNKDNPDGELPRGSQGSLRDSEPGSSDTDSLKEYADGELGKFNEEGSFIGQYGDKKQRPADDTEQGGAAYSTFV